MGLTLRTAMVFFRKLDWFYPAVPSMARLQAAAPMAMARFSASAPMARTLRFCMLFPPPPVLRPATAKELFRKPDWFYRAPPCMGRPIKAAPIPMAPCSPSTPMARVSSSCTLSVPPPVRVIPALTATGLTRRPPWFYLAAPSMEQPRMVENVLRRRHRVRRHYEWREFWRPCILFTVISGPNNANSDGAYPLDNLVVSGNTVYGTGVLWRFQRHWLGGSPSTPMARVLPT